LWVKWLVGQKVAKPLETAMKINRMDVAEELEGLPPQKMHCSNLGADALHAAIRDYWVKNGKIKPEEAKFEEGHEGKMVVVHTD